MGVTVKRKTKIQPQRGDIVQWRVNRGTYLGKRTSTHSYVSVSGGPQCNVVTKDLSVWARPCPDGFEVFFDNQSIGFVADKSGIAPLRQTHRTRVQS